MNLRYHLPKHLIDPAVHLLERSSCVIVKIKASKMEQSRAGVSLCVGKTWGLLCPVVTILPYLARMEVQDFCSGLRICHHVQAPSWWY